MPIRYLIGALLLLGICASQAMAEQVIPFKDLDGLIEVDASIGHQASIPVLVDLGAGVNALADSFKVTPTGFYTGFRLSGKRIEMATGTVGSIALGDYRIDHPLVATWKGLDNAPVKGLIAATAFRTAMVRFDFARHELVISDTTAVSEIAPSSIRIPIALLDDRGITLTPFARFNFGRGVSGLCEIDTGSQGFFLNARLAQKLGINLEDPSLKHAGNAADGHPVVADIPEIALDGAPSTKIARPKAMFGNYIYDCNIGNEFWKDRSFTLDIQEKALFIPRPNG